MYSHKFRLLLILFLVFSVTAAAQQPPAAAPHKLNLVVVEGEGAINNIKLRTTRETIVQVQDENHRPVAAAAVVFFLPGDGPGGTFADGTKSATVVTDSTGRATMPRVQLSSNPGSYQIRVHASSQGVEADTAIAQSSIAGAAGLSTGAIIGIVAAVGAIGGVVAVVASKGKGSSSSTPTPPTPTPTPAGTISAGTGIVIGAPK